MIHTQNNISMPFAATSPSSFSRGIFPMHQPDQILAPSTSPRLPLQLPLIAVAFLHFKCFSASFTGSMGDFVELVRQGITNHQPQSHNA